MYINPKNQKRGMNKNMKSENKIPTLTMSSLRILIHLRKNPSGKQESISSLENIIERRFCIIHQCISKLEKHGYVTCRLEGRCKEISITPEGLSDLNEFLGLTDCKAKPQGDMND